MITTLEYALLSDFVYTSGRPAKPRTGLGHIKGLQEWVHVDGRGSGVGIGHALQAGVFRRGADHVVAFKGTDPDLFSLKMLSASTNSGWRDAGADILLSIGFNLCAYQHAQTFMSDVRARGPKDAKWSVCGHSLGGAIAQVVGHRMDLPFVTFNAPGVAIAPRSFSEAMAGRDVAPKSRLLLDTLRIAGSVTSAVVHPRQMREDVFAFFNVNSGVNARVSGDMVSQLGYHYGRVVTIPNILGPGIISPHMMSTVIACIRRWEHKDRDPLLPS